MDFNLILTAQTLVLAPHLRESAPVNGMLVLKNIPAKTYLTVTKEQWVLLQQFRKARTVPSVLGYALEERLCLPLQEFFELVLKAVRANILLEPQATPPEVKPLAWQVAIRAQTIAWPILILFFLGLGATFAFPPQLPKNALDVLAGLAVLSATLSLGACIAGCLLRGAGVDVYRARISSLIFPPQFNLDRSDAILLPPLAHKAVMLARPAILAVATGVLAWQRPEWNLLPLLGLAFSLRPILGGKIATLLRLGGGRILSDSEHAFIFPPNLRPRARWRLLRTVLVHPEIWSKMGYGIIWALAIVYLGAQLADIQPWELEFWRINGMSIGIATGGSFVALILGFIGWEVVQFGRSRIHHRRQELRLWYKRWFQGKKIPLNEDGRFQSASSSPLFRTLVPADRGTLTQLLAPSHHGALHWFPEYSGQPTHAALIVSGKIGLYRVSSAGRTSCVHILTEGDVVGLHNLADPEFPEYRARSLTPVTLLKIDRPTIEQHLTQKISAATLTNLVLKLPFLRNMSLCRSWHAQAIERFAQLSTISNWAADGVIVKKDDMSHYFFVIFEQDALVTRNKKRLAILRAGEFFGEIGLLQNSTATADIVARRGTRCLNISRPDFLRFVTHNHLVALELERVSSERLGGPIFPLKSGNFRIM